MAFDEDDSHIHTGHASHNMAILRRIAHNLNTSHDLPWSGSPAAAGAFLTGWVMTQGYCSLTGPGAAMSSPLHAVLPPDQRQATVRTLLHRFAPGSGARASAADRLSPRPGAPAAD